jgi:hypothetical protein
MLGEMLKWESYNYFFIRRGKK